METLVTEKERRQIRKMAMTLVGQLPGVSLFDHKHRWMLAERLADGIIAEKEGREAPEFPPEGFEMTITKQHLPGGETIAATQSIRSDNELTGALVPEQPKMDVVVPL